MINEQEYDHMVCALAEFVSTTMDLWAKQKDMNVILQKQIEEQLEVLRVYRGLLSDLRNQNIAYKALLTEHEKRLIDVERCLKNDSLYRGSNIPSSN
jgi:hypothetical protein